MLEEEFPAALKNVLSLLRPRGVFNGTILRYKTSSKPAIESLIERRLEGIPNPDVSVIERNLKNAGFVDVECSTEKISA